MLRAKWGMAGAVILLLMVMVASLAQAGVPVPANREGPPAPSVFLEIDGAELGGMRLPVPLEVKRPLMDQSCSVEQVCTGDLYRALADLEATAENITESARHDTSKAIIANIRARIAELNKSLEIADLDGDGYLDKTYQPGQPVYGNITFEGAVSRSKAFYTWFQEASQGKKIRKSISIIFRSRDGEEEARYTLFDAFPTNWSITAQGELREALTVKVERIEFKTREAAGGGGSGGSDYSVVLEANGRPLGSFALTGPITGQLGWGGGDCDDTNGRCLAGTPPRCGEGACTAEALAALTRLEQQAERLGEPAKQEAVRSLTTALRGLMTELEGSLAGETRAGRPTFGQITLQRPVGTGASLSEWVLATGEGKPWKRSLALSIVSPNGETLARFTMQGGPVGYSMAEGVEKIELAVEKVERAE